MPDRRDSASAKTFRMRVAFHAAPVWIDVEAESLDDAWKRRNELAAATQPDSWRPDPISVEGMDDDRDDGIYPGAGG